MLSESVMYRIMCQESRSGTARTVAGQAIQEVIITSQILDIDFGGHKREEDELSYKDRSFADIIAQRHSTERRHTS